MILRSISDLMLFVCFSSMVSGHLFRAEVFQKEKRQKGNDGQIGIFIQKGLAVVTENSQRSIGLVRTGFSKSQLFKYQPLSFEVASG